ncbi:histidinol dehydrogenase, partial [Actinomadura adrarensis]
MSIRLKSPTGGAPDTRGDDGVSTVVREVIEDIRTNGDEAVRRYSEKFDDWSPESFLLTAERIEELVASLPREVVDDIVTVQANVRSFAQRQRDTLQDLEVEAQPGVFLGQRHLPIVAAGAYVPGGRYPLTASAHMTVV